MDITVYNFARGYQMEPWVLRAFADGMLDDLHDDDYIPGPVVDVLTEALTYETE